MTPSHHQPSRLRSEEDAARFAGWAVRKFRKFDLPFIQPPGTRRKDQRLYREDVLLAHRDAHGTFRDVLAAAASRTHRQLTYRGEAFSGAQHYQRYKAMVSRCTNPGDPDYENYGGRGIQVHQPWLDDPIKFFRYLDFIGHVPKGYSLDRIDNEGDYEPGNLRFVDAGMQNANRRPWADGDACCDCASGFCVHDATSCSVECFDWDGARRAIVQLGIAHGRATPYDPVRARRHHDRQCISAEIRLPGPPPPSRWDALLEQMAFDRWVEEELVLA